MKPFLLAAVLACCPGLVLAAGTAPRAAPARDGMIKVAFVLGPHANVMDIAGPWEVFQDTSFKDEAGHEVSPYALYTVAADTRSVHSAGANHPGLAITPDYDFDHAPTPDIVVLPAQRGTPGLDAWLRKAHAAHAQIMSVCTGAFLLADTGLLDGKPATTHHWYFGNFTRDHPGVKLMQGVRYVQASPQLFTAGGLTSGVDLALHLVDARFGREVAEQTANFMEYLGTGWKSNQGIAALDLPVTRELWSGELAPHQTVALHVITYGASPRLSIDIPSLHVDGAPVAMKQAGDKLTLSFEAAGRPATLEGQMNEAGSVLDAMLFTGGQGHPVALVKTAAPKAGETSSAEQGAGAAAPLR